MRSRFLRIIALLVGVGLAGFLVAASGIIPIKASSGHWAVTAWLLHFAMQRSVATHSLGLHAPTREEPWLALKGAGHYETGCRPCHGSPEFPHPRIPQQMTPHPPYLPPRVNDWEREELFYIVKHGVKFTGMPAWPSQQRDDEVWAIVAFLRRLPGIDAGAYRKLVYGQVSERLERAPIGAPGSTEELREAVTESCARCHGIDGLGRGTGAFPKLAGQRPHYLYAALEAYANGSRHSGIMEPIAAALSPEVRRQLASYYGALRPPSPKFSARDDGAAIERGRAIALRGIPQQRVPSCSDCHGPEPERLNANYPILAGQYPAYLVLQLELFKKEQRGGSRYAHLMRHVAAGLTRAQIRDVALYYALARDRSR